MEWSLAPRSAASVSTSSSASSPSFSGPPPDVVCLQEVWCAADARSIASAAALGGHLLYSHHFRNGVFGSGLLTLSAFPISQASFAAFAAAGDQLAVLQGDGVAGKGVGCVALDLSGTEGGAGTAAAEAGRRSEGGRRRAASGGGSGAPRLPSPSPSSPEILVVANTHLAAAYKDAHEEEPREGGRARATTAKRNKKDEKKKSRRGAQEGGPSRGPAPFVVPSDANGPVRLAQTLALAESVRGFAASVGAGAGAGAGVILCGDLNSPPRSLEAALLRRLSPGVAAAEGGEAPLGDAWAFLEEREALAASELDEEQDSPPPATPGRDRWGGATANRPLDDGERGSERASQKAAAAATATAGAGKRPARLDFVWSFSAPSRLLPVSARIALTRDQGTGRRLSDHAGVEVVFELPDLRRRRSEGGARAGGGEETENAENGGDGGRGGGGSGGSGPELELLDPLAVAVPLIEERALRAAASADAAGAASLGCLVAAAALSSAALLRLSSHLSSSSSSSALSLSLAVALALALSFALGSLSALLFALGYGGRHALSSALGAAAERARLRLHSERRRSGRRRRW